VRRSPADTGRPAGGGSCRTRNSTESLRGRGKRRRSPVMRMARSGVFRSRGDTTNPIAFPPFPGSAPEPPCGSPCERAARRRPFPAKSDRGCRHRNVRHPTMGRSSPCRPLRPVGSSDGRPRRPCRHASRHRACPGSWERRLSDGMANGKSAEERGASLADKVAERMRPEKHPAPTLREAAPYITITQERSCKEPARRLPAIAVQAARPVRASSTRLRAVSSSTPSTAATSRARRSSAAS